MERSKASGAYPAPGAPGACEDEMWTAARPTKLSVWAYNLAHAPRRSGSKLRQQSVPEETGRDFENAGKRAFGRPVRFCRKRNALVGALSICVCEGSA